MYFHCIKTLRGDCKNGFYSDKIWESGEKEEALLMYEAYVSNIETITGKLGVPVTEYGNREAFEEFCKTLIAQEKALLQAERMG